MRKAVEQIVKFSEDEKEQILYEHIVLGRSIASLQYKWKCSYKDIGRAIYFNLQLYRKNKNYAKRINNKKFLANIESIELQIDSYVAYLCSEEGQLVITPKQYKKLANEITRLQKRILQCKNKLLAG